MTFHWKGEVIFIVIMGVAFMVFVITGHYMLGYALIPASIIGFWIYMTGKSGLDAGVDHGRHQHTGVADEQHKESRKHPQ